MRDDKEKEEGKEKVKEGGDVGYVDGEEGKITKCNNGKENV